MMDEMDVEQHAEIRREAATMVFYVSVVEIAEFAALPEDHFSHGVVTGPVGMQLLAIVWGTAVGLASRIGSPSASRLQPSAVITRLAATSRSGLLSSVARRSLPRSRACRCYSCQTSAPKRPPATFQPSSSA